MTDLQLSPLTLAVVRHKLQAVAEEMVETMTRTCFSPILNQNQDFSAVVLDAQGRVLLDLAAASPSASEASASVGRLLDDRRCPACEAAAESERRAVALTSEAYIAGRQESLLPCLPHLAGLLSSLPDEATREAVEHHVARLERLSEDAQRFALRQDASRTDLGGKDDRDIGTRVMRALVGHPDALAGATRDPQRML